MDIQALAHEAVMYTLPLYEMARMRAATSPRRNRSGAFAGDAPESTLRWVSLFVHTRRLLTPADRQVVTPNNDTLYTNAWLDLSHGPIAIDVPDTGDRYYVLGFLDFWTNPFGYAGRRTTGTGAQTLFVHGPRWRGTVPAGAIEVAAPTDAVWILGRILTDAAEDAAVVHALQDRFTMRAVGRDAGEPFLGDPYDVGLQPGDVLGDARRYARVISRALVENPPPAAQASMIERLAPLGLVTGDASDDVLDLLGAAIRDVLTDLDTPQPSSLGGGWTLPVRVRDSYGTDWRTRAFVARNYIGALGIDEAMYVMADVDGDGVPLDGRRAYALRFAPGALPDVDAFWSLTMYRKADCLLADNPMARYSIGDRTPGLRRDADGGLTIRLQHAPPDESANWLPSPPEPFYVTLRLYQPGASHLDERFRYPPIRAVA